MKYDCFILNEYRVNSVAYCNIDFYKITSF